jgi:hypothetical protein
MVTLRWHMEERDKILLKKIRQLERGLYDADKEKDLDFD